MTLASEQPRLESRARVFACAALIVAITFATLWRLVAQADLSNWDDSHTIIENPRLSPPTLASLGWMWAHPYADLYVPVTYTVWWTLSRTSYTTDADGQVVQNAHVFHTANVALHAAAAVAAFLLVRRLLRVARESPLSDRAIPDDRAIDFAACTGALLFAVHPVQVEPVGWASGLKDVLAGLLAIVALDRYVAYATAPLAKSRGRAIDYALCITATLGAMLSKPSTVVLPLIIAAIHLVVLRHRRAGLLVRVVRGTLLLFALAVPVVAIGWVNQKAEALTTGVSVALRPLIATDAIAFYVGKVLAPVGLCIDYGRHPQAVLASGSLWWTWVVPAVLGVGAWLVRRRAPLVTAGAILFAVALLPVLGLRRFDFQQYSTVADHYLYLPMLGVALVVSDLLARAATSRASRSVIVGLGVIAFAIITTLAALSLRQTRFWLGSGPMFQRVVDVNPRSWVGYNNLAQATAAAGNDVDAIRLVRRSLELFPENYVSHMVLGSILMEKRDPDLPGAIRALAKAVRLNPRAVEARVNLANAYGRAGRLDDAIRQYQAALQLDPSNVIANRMLPRAVGYRDHLRRQGAAPAATTRTTGPADATDHARIGASKPEESDAP